MNKFNKMQTFEVINGIKKNKKVSDTLFYRFEKEKKKKMCLF